MPLIIDRLELHDFRSYRELSVELAPGLTVVSGPNAVGKTNLIEAIQLVTAGESFRRPKWGEVVRSGAERSRAIMRASGEGEVLDVSLEIVAARRRYTINDKPRRPKDLLGKMPCVVFTPDDLFMIKGPAEERRRTVDETGDQLSPSYARLRTTYARLLRQRNAALRAGVEDAQMVALNEQIIECGAKLTSHRARLAARLSLKASELYSGMAGGEGLTVALRPSWAKVGVPAGDLGEEQAKKSLEAAFRSGENEERARLTTIVGPHRDDLLFEINGSDARTYASQGQQRSAALAWKLAEVGVIEDVLHKRPILLLDDVMSELDKERRFALTELLSRTTQTVITTTNLQYFDSSTLEPTTVLELER